MARSLYALSTRENCCAVTFLQRLRHLSPNLRRRTPLARSREATSAPSVSELRIHSRRNGPPASNSHNPWFNQHCGMDGRPAIIPQVQIDAVRMIVAGPHPFEPHPFLNCGDRIRVRSGPLLGVEGILVRKKGMDRLVVSMEMLGRSAAVEIDVSDIARIEPLSY